MSSLITVPPGPAWFAIGVTGSVMIGWGASMLYVYVDPPVAINNPFAPLVVRGELGGVGMRLIRGPGIVSVPGGALIAARSRCCLVALVK